MKREKSTGSRTEHLDGLERNDFCDFEKQRKRAYQKGKIDSNEQSKKGGQPKCVCGKELDFGKSKSFGKVDSCENRPRAQSGFVKPIQNGLRKKQNLILCRPFRAKTGLAVRENGIRFQKE